MRTTLELDDDLVHVARQLARQRGTTMGRIVSDMIRTSLKPKAGAEIRNGVLLFVPRKGAAKPHLDLVNKLRDGE